MLSIETSTKNSSIALALEGKIIALKESKEQRPSEVLHLYIEEVFKNTKFTLQDLQAVALSKGPGSYTGLRVGTSAAKGLCFSLNIPLISLETLEVLANQAKDKSFDFVIPMLNSKRMEVFTAIFDKKENHKSATFAKVLEDKSFQEYLAKGKVLFIGDGVKKFKEICKHPNAVFQESFPSAKEMISSAQNKFTQQDFENTAYFEPYYLKDFVVK